MEKTKKILDLKAKIKAKEENNQQLREQIEQKETALSTFDEIQRAHDHQKFEYKMVTRSSIAKIQYYEPEPDLYYTDELDF